MRHALRAAPLAALASLCLGQPAAAHAVVGNRFFPATLTVDDPGVADELSLPTVTGSRTGDAARRLDVSGEWAKRLTNDLAISFGEDWTRLKTPDAPTARGFQNLETTLKYQAFTSAPHEAIVAAGVSYEWGASGAGRVGAERHSTVTPSIFFGKGAGDLPDGLGWARPFAVTGVLGYAIPTRSHEVDERVPRVMSLGLAVEYSLPYLAAHVRDLGLPEVVNHLTPLVEANFERPVGRGVGGRTTGTVNPGVIWSGRRLQLGVEASFPINRDSGRGTGFVVQAHWYLDDLFPKSLGRPVW